MLRGLLLGFGVLAGTSCTRTGPTEPSSSGPVAESSPPRPRVPHHTSDTVLITIETTRTDRVGPLYGHPRQTFPLLSGRAHSGRVYRNAYSPSSWTLPSMVSIYTGRSPVEHGVEAVDRQVHPDIVTLGMRLAEQDVQAAFFGVNPVFVVDRGLARGFDHWQAEVGWPAGQLNQAVLNWLDQDRDPTRPLFLHVHYFDPHCPYIPPARVTVDGPAVPSSGSVPADRLAEMGGCYRLDEADGRPVLDVADYLDRYDRELRAVDIALDRLLERLGERGLTGPEDRLVVAADHGEAFWEHDNYGHSHTLWAETTRVPLIIWDRDGAGQLDTPVGLAGLFEGLAASAGKIRPEQAGPVVQATKAAGTPWVAVVEPDRRWLSDGTNAWRTHPALDPHDKALVPVDPTIEPEALRKARQLRILAPALSPNDEQREQLRALGYSF